MPIDRQVPLTLSKYDTGIHGQHVPNGPDTDHPDPESCTGLGRECDYGIYEGQYVEDEWNGFGRRIIANGDYYIGMWKDGMRNGYGRYVYNAAGNCSFVSGTSANPKPAVQIVVEEGQWVEDEFKGEPREVDSDEYTALLQTPLFN